MNEKDKLFELYKIYISINNDYNNRFYSVHDFAKESLEDAKVALEYFNSQLKEGEQNGKRNNRSD